MSLLHLNHHLVYRFRRRPGAEPRLPEDYGFERLTRSSTDRFFRDRPDLQGAFRRFLDRGFLGGLLHRGDAWAAYAWFSLPDTEGPHHLPKWVQRLPVHWYFYAHTREGHRGLGLNTALIRLLEREARAAGPVDLYGDTRAANLPSRKAMLASGFEPSGVLRCLALTLPGWDGRSWGRWQREAPHPVMSPFKESR